MATVDAAEGTLRSPSDSGCLSSNLDEWANQQEEAQVLQHIKSPSLTPAENAATLISTAISKGTLHPVASGTASQSTSGRTQRGPWDSSLKSVRPAVAQVIIACNLQI